MLKYGYQDDRQATIAMIQPVCYTVVAVVDIADVALAVTNLVQELYELDYVFYR